MKVFRDKQCFNTQFAHMLSVFCPDRQPSPMPLPLNNNCPSKAPFQSPIQINSTSIKQNVSIQENLIVAISLKNGCDFQHSNSKHMARFPEETSQTVLSLSVSSKLKLPSRNYFTITTTTINNFNNNFVLSSLTDIVGDRQFL